MRWMIPVLLCVQIVSAQSPLVNVQTVAVSDQENTADTNGYGSVAYEFRMGRFEVTLGQYASFLNAVAASDPYNLYDTNMGSFANVAGISRSGSSGAYSYNVVGPLGPVQIPQATAANRPITYVNWFDAARFANWLHNGATNGASTETGAYTLNGATSGLFNRNAEATWWLPSESEWYKASYYKSGGTNAGYWRYPTKSDAAPSNTVGSGTNQANYYALGPEAVAAGAADFSVTQSADYDPSQNYLTDGGIFSNSSSSYGTYDQGGNVWEWNDAVVNGFERGLRGGAFYPDGTIPDPLASSSRSSVSPNGSGDALIGFRVASVPEPSTYALLLLAGAGAALMARRRAKRR
jgi:sulfatase modifying factor 1